MSESGKIAVAFALSVLAHVSLFAALALMPVVQTVPVKPVPEEEHPLEVTIEAAPAEVETVPILPDRLAPENLKKADKAPEKPKIMAAHDSQATPLGAAPTPLPSAATAPTPPPDLSATLVSAATPTLSPQPKADEVGIDALGNYGNAVGNAIGTRWELYRKDLPVGEVRIKFAIDAEGRVSEIKVVSNTAAPSNAAMAIRAVKEAKIPPISPDVLSKTPSGRTEITYTFISFPTQ